MPLRTVAIRARVFVFLVLSLCAAPARSFAQDIAPSTAERGRFIALYSSFATLQLLDAHSTLKALGGGAGTEGNPLMRTPAAQPMTLFALKAGAAATTVVLAEKVRKHSRVGAYVLMAGINSAYATVVAHNYRTGIR